MDVGDEREAAAELKGDSNVEHEIQLLLNAQFKEPAGLDLQRWAVPVITLAFTLICSAVPSASYPWSVG